MENLKQTNNKRNKITKIKKMCRFRKSWYILKIIGNLK